MKTVTFRKPLIAKKHVCEHDQKADIQRLQKCTDIRHNQPYAMEMKKHSVKVVVRCCDPTYGTESLKEEGIRVVDYPFEDGAAPPGEIVKQWLDLVVGTFEEDVNCCIAVHCVAGLGRAPVLVAIALIEYGMKYSDAVDYIRQKRRGAINQRQLEFLERYKPTNRHGSCCVM